jgi:hypothetical protein
LDFEIWNLKFEIWNLEFYYWNFCVLISFFNVFLLACFPLKTTALARMAADSPQRSEDLQRTAGLASKKYTTVNNY